MTRKDYELIAEVLKNSSEIMDNISMAFLIDNFAQELAKGNSLFNRDKFINACGADYSEVEYIINN